MGTVANVFKQGASCTSLPPLGEAGKVGPVELVEAASVGLALFDDDDFEVEADVLDDLDTALVRVDDAFVDVLLLGIVVLLVVLFTLLELVLVIVALVLLFVLCELVIFVELVLLCFLVELVLLYLLVELVLLCFLVELVLLCFLVELVLLCFLVELVVVRLFLVELVVVFFSELIMVLFRDVVVEEVLFDDKMRIPYVITTRPPIVFPPVAIVASVLLT